MTPLLHHCPRKLFILVLTLHLSRARAKGPVALLQTVCSTAYVGIILSSKFPRFVNRWHPLPNVNPQLLSHRAHTTPVP